MRVRHKTLPIQAFSFAALLVESAMVRTMSRPPSTTVTLLDPSGYRRTPWKNGGGLTIDIAEHDGLWRFGRTPIASAGPFSDYSGFDRVQMLVRGRGLVLETPDGDLDVRQPFVPVRFAGETPIVSRLEAGAVEVVNLIGKRDAVRIDLRTIEPGAGSSLMPGVHIAYCADAPATLSVAERRHELAARHALRVDAVAATVMHCDAGRTVLASITGT
jgi:environmental stress-induced protein Ves